MELQISNTAKLKAVVTQFFLPSPLELIPYFFASLLTLLIASNQVLLVILADGSPVTPIAVTDVFGQRLTYLSGLLAIPILGRIVLFLFWLGIGSIVYMLVWLFQNIAVEVYDNLVTAKIKNPKDQEQTEGWWGTGMSHTIFVGSSVVLLLFFGVIAVNFLFPAWVQLFQIGLQSISELAGIVKFVISILGTMITLHIFVLFWKLFSRMRSYIYNNFY